MLPDELDFLRPWRLGRILAPVSALNLARGLRRFAEHEPAVPIRVDARTLERQFRASAHLAASGPQTVLHGDAHLANTYLLRGGRLGFYDWQLARTGNWSHDVGYFLIAALESAERRRHEREFLEDYRHALRAAGIDPPTPEEAFSRYRASPAFGLCTWLHTLSFASFQPLSSCLATVRRFASAYADLDTAHSIVARER